MAKMDRERLTTRLLSSVPLALWRAMSSLPLVIPYYHIVSDEEPPHVKHLYAFRNVRQFREDLDFLLANYRPVGLPDLIAHLGKGTPLPRHSFLLTFDDGFREMHEVVAPILKAKGVPAAFFLTTGFLDNADMAHHCKASVLVEHLAQRRDATVVKTAQDILSRNGVSGDSLPSQMVSVRYGQRRLVDEIAGLCGCDFKQYLSSRRPYLESGHVHSLLKQGFGIGAHSLDHPLFADLPLAEQIRQTVESTEFLADRFQVPYRAFAFPHSDLGVSGEFFDRLHGAHQLDVSFGTAGMVRHFCRRNLERFAMEKTMAPARRVLARHYPRGLYRSLIPRNEIAASCG